MLSLLSCPQCGLQTELGFPLSPTHTLLLWLWDSRLRAVPMLCLFYLKCQLNFFFLFWQIPSSPCLKLTLCLLVLFRVTLSLLWILTARVFCFPINCLYSWFAFLLFACGEPSSALLVSHVNNVPNPGTTWYLDHALAWQSDLAECCFPLRLFIL